MNSVTAQTDQQSFATSALAVSRSRALTQLNSEGLAQLFLDARTHTQWQPLPVDDGLLRELYELARMAPTTANSQPMRLLFLKSPEAKETLRPALAPANVEKTMTAPVTVVVAHDLAFYEQLPKLMTHVDARAWFASQPAEQIERVASHGAGMQGAYLILAARALGLDCGPIGGFDRAAVDASFFAGTHWRSNFLLNLGYGDRAGLYREIRDWSSTTRAAFSDLSGVFDHVLRLSE